MIQKIFWKKNWIIVRKCVCAISYKYIQERNNYHVKFQVADVYVDDHLQLIQFLVDSQERVKAAFCKLD